MTGESTWSLAWWEALILWRPARLMGPVEVSFTKRKHPRASGEGDPALRTMADFCSGNAGNSIDGIRII